MDYIQTIWVTSQERLQIEVKLLLSANIKSYMPRPLAQQRMTLSDLELLFHASRASDSCLMFDYVRAINFRIIINNIIIYSRVTLKFYPSLFTTKCTNG